jgi:hypothetical protein
MMMTRFAVLALLCLAVAATAATGDASAASSCTDVGYRTQVSAASNMISTSLDFSGVESWRAAEAWALKAWRSFRAIPQPCNASYRRYLQDETNVATNLWWNARAGRSNNPSARVRYLTQAGQWTDRAAAEMANWPSAT